MLTLYFVVDARQLTNKRLYMHIRRPIGWRHFASGCADVAKCRLLQMLLISLHTLPVALVFVLTAAKCQNIIPFITCGKAPAIQACSFLRGYPSLFQRGSLLVSLCERL